MPPTITDPAASQYQAFALAIAAWRQANPKTRGLVPKFHEFKVLAPQLAGFVAAIAAFVQSGGALPKIGDFAPKPPATPPPAPASTPTPPPAPTPPKPAASAAPVPEVPAKQVGQS